MANANWNGGHAKGRAQAHAWLRHNDRGRRADPQVSHSNREIDKSRTRLNFEVGPTRGMTYEQKRDRLDAILDEWGYPTDAEIGRVGRTTPSCMQGIVLYAPDALDVDAALADGRLGAWAEAAVDEAARLFGAENVVGAFVDVDERHAYADARTGERRLSRYHVHLYVAPVCDVRVTEKRFVYLRPDGTETLDEAEAQRVYITPCNSETDDPSRAARESDGTPRTGPRHARMRNGRRKVRKQRRSEATETRRALSGSEFSSRANIVALNRAIHLRTREDFDIEWNSHEPGTYRREEGRENESVEDLKAQSAARDVEARVAKALERADALLDEADAARDEAERDLSRRAADLDSRERLLDGREESLRAREEAAAERASEAEGRAEAAVSAAREHDGLVDAFLGHARALVERFVGGAVERFCSKLDSLAGIADRALGEARSGDERMLWSIARESARSVSSFVRRNRDDPAVREWSELEFRPGAEPSRVQRVSAQLYWLAGAALHRSRELPEGRTASAGWFRCGQEAYDLSNALSDADGDDPRLAAWADGDEFLLERLEEARPAPLPRQPAPRAPAPEPVAGGSPAPGARAGDGPEPGW